MSDPRSRNSHEVSAAGRQSGPRKSIKALKLAFDSRDCVRNLDQLVNLPEPAPKASPAFSEPPSTSPWGASRTSGRLPTLRWGGRELRRRRPRMVCSWCQAHLGGSAGSGHLAQESAHRGPVSVFAEVEESGACKPLQDGVQLGVGDLASKTCPVGKELRGRLDQFISL